MFWAPKAKIKLKPVIKPNSKKLIYYFKIFENFTMPLIRKFGCSSNAYCPPFDIFAKLI